MAEVLNLTATGVSKGRDQATRELLADHGRQISSGYLLATNLRDMQWLSDEWDMEQLGDQLTSLGWEWGTRFVTGY